MSQLNSLAALATKAGEGKAFLNRFDQGQQLIGNVLRQRQQQDQAVNAKFEREARLQQLNAQQEGQRFSQALALQKEQRQAQQEEQQSAVDERERNLATKLKVRQLDRLEADLGIRERGQELAESKFGAQSTGAQGAAGIQNQLKRLAETREAISISLDASQPGFQEPSPEQRIQMEQNLAGIKQEESRLGASLIENFKSNAALAQATQTDHAVTAKEAGPALKLSLKASGQSRVLETPINPETGIPDFKKFRVGKIYQTPDGPAVYMGEGQVEMIDELGDVDTVRNLQ